jgi:hypothetical protein
MTKNELLELKRDRLLEHIKAIFVAKDDENTKVEYLYILETNTNLSFEVSSEYDLKITFDQWEKLSELFKTTKISSSDFNHSGGCQTCGYGSTRELTFNVYEIPPGVIEELTKD